MLFWIQKTHTHTPHKQPTRMRHQPTVISTSSSWNDRFNLEQNIEVLETTSVSAKRSPPPPVLGAWGWGDWSPAAVIYNVRTIYLYLITICVLCDVWSGTKEVKRKIHASKSSSILVIRLLQRDWQKINDKLCNYHWHVMVGKKKFSGNLADSQKKVAHIK